MAWVPRDNGHRGLVVGGHPDSFACGPGARCGRPQAPSFKHNVAVLALGTRPARRILVAGLQF